MTKTASNSTPSPVGTRGDRVHLPRIERELEVVLKSGGVYCFVAKPKPARVEVPSPVVGVARDRGLIPIEG